jgi:hypothetical protein
MTTLVPPEAGPEAGFSEETVDTGTRMLRVNVAAAVTLLASVTLTV